MLRMKWSSCPSIVVSDIHEAIDLTIRLMQEEQEKEDNEKINLAFGLICENCPIASKKQQRINKQMLERYVNLERLKLKAELPEKLDKIVDEWQAKYLQPTSDGQIEELKQKLADEVKKG